MVQLGLLRAEQIGTLICDGYAMQKPIALGSPDAVGGRNSLQRILTRKQVEEDRPGPLYGPIPAYLRSS